MAQHTRFARFKTRIREAAGERTKRRDERETAKFARDSQRLARATALEKRRAELRQAQASSRPKGTTSRGGGGFSAFRDFATDFSSRQRQTQPSGMSGFGAFGTKQEAAKVTKPRPIRRRKGTVTRITRRRLQ